ncbi:hypothetical protein C8A00DRAFT_39609 [Chaetomidium leptoderma]|uniref:TNT domain-containing protein n=1 Tax=Chaetomidium leptoderma TaxID=669021 RepID=A0AAN6VUI0_9PEZI|nr:hypothetical protein C8A00DRAFT_39609 [Chaetomidium leptoderma]
MKFSLVPLLALLPFLPTSLAEGGEGETSSPSCGRRNTPRYCAGTNYTTSLLQTYLCGDSRLGPTRLPLRSDDLAVAPVLANALYGYDRFGGLCPGEFIRQWFNESEGWWNYPPQSGFVVANPEGGPTTQRGGVPIQGKVTLAEETLLDRFGSEYGTFVSPAGAPYAQRALPPSNLVVGDVAYPYNYHVYTVVKPLVVLAGPIAPWFGQAGAGVQYMIYQNVATLISDGFLRREDPSVLLP